MKQKIYIFLIPLLCIAGFFYIQNVLATEFEQGGVIFNEVAWMGMTVSANDEWIELKNITNRDIDLSGWSIVARDGSPKIELSGIIPAGGYFLLERTDDNTVSTITADLIYAGALGNDGEFLGLRDNEQNLIDFIDAAAGWLAGDNDTKKTMEKNNSAWQTSAEVGGTPRADNSVGAVEEIEQTENETEQPEEETEEGLEEEQTAEVTEEEEEIGRSCGLGDVLINEFVADPADGEVEWIELINISGNSVDLSGWTIEEGSGAETTLDGVIANYGFFVIEKPAGNLNNAGDIIILKDVDGVLIDQVAYGNWDDGQTSNNAPAAADPWAVARQIDGSNSFNNQNDFSITTTLTKGQSNIITSEEEAEEIVVGYDYSQNIIISEIFPNPLGDDSEAEFIELYNSGNSEINLAGWRLGDASKKRFEFDSKSVISANGYLAVYRSDSKIALNNNGDTVRLFQPFQDEPLQAVVYERAEEEQSYSLIDNNFVWTSEITPGLVNAISSTKTEIVVDFACPDFLEIGQPFIFDGTDSFIEGSEDIIYHWDFGDGIELNLPSPQHTFLSEGAFSIKLKISDGETEATTEKSVVVVRSLADNLVELQEHNLAIVINEMLPSPAGSDTDEEWVELYNFGSLPISLAGWQLDDADGGSSPYKFSASSTILSDDYLLVARPESGLALNNDTDAIRLFDNNNVLVDSVEYSETYEGQSYARGENDKWFWTATLTPAGKNIIDVELADLEVYATATTGVYLPLTVEEARQAESGQLVKVRGVVAVEPNVLAAQYFYIINNGFGIQVYNYSKDFPFMKVGDEIEVAGEISEINSEKRIKTKTAADFSVLSVGQIVEPVEMSCMNINESSLGSLVKISGMVTERKSSTIYIDDGTSEASLYIKSLTGISPKIFVEGANYSVVGIISQTSTGTKIMPRYSDDIVQYDIESGPADSGKVLGETADSNEWEIAARDKKMELLKYLLVIAGGVIVVLTGLLIKLSRK